MATFYNQEFGQARTARDLLTLYPLTLNNSGYYFLYPNGRSNPGQLVYCDMSTDGGGWMLIARSHPSGTPSTWGWLGNKESDIKTFSSPYQAGWGQYWKDYTNFTSFLFGNRKNINDNTWGPFIYKVSGINYTNFMTSDTQQQYTNSVIASDTSVYNLTTFPGMQNVTGFPSTGLTNKNYYLRDCCGYAAYGAMPNSMSTTYINHPTQWTLAGPWGAGSSTVVGGDFVQTTGSTNYGGTNQYMIFVK